MARMGERRIAYRFLVSKFEGERPLVRPRVREEDSIKICVKGMRQGVWTGLIWLGIERMIILKFVLKK